MPPKKPNISKSRFVAGVQCTKRLWLEANHYDLRDETSDAAQAIFDQGHEVGELAQKLFPGGLLISEDHRHIPEAVRSTVKAVEGGAPVLYEATAVHGRLLARADILARAKKGSNEWDMIEVKSTTEAKDNHLWDLAIQRHIFENEGYRIRRTLLCHLDTDYVRHGELDVEKLFGLSDVTRDVASLMKNVPKMVDKFLDIVDAKISPVAAIGRRCSDPYDCPFIGHCWKDVPEDSVFTLANDRKKLKDGLYQLGVIRVGDIPDEEPLTPKQRRQVKAARTGEPYWDKDAVKEYLDTLEYPLAYLDFEGFNPAIPPYDGTWPFQQIPFQFSLHIVERPGAKVTHQEFLASGDGDPRRPFAEALVGAVPKKGSVVVYNAGYEGGRLKECWEAFPDLKKNLEDIKARLNDLIVPFRNMDVVYPGFLGSYSIKYVLPVLVPGMTYKGMEIGEGGAASRAFVRLTRRDLPPDERARLRKALLTYCGQDTLAMVKLVEVLEKECG